MKFLYLCSSGNWMNYCLLLLLTSITVLLDCSAQEQLVEQQTSDTSMIMDVSDSDIVTALQPDEESTAKSEPDRHAQIFRLKCAGCHTIGGGALSGPDLKPTATWPYNNLADAIRRMEQHVGPIPENEVDILALLLQSEDARERLDAEQQRVMRLAAQELEPASINQGKLLFEGKLPLRNGGLSCTACHQAAGIGGNLAMDLTDVFARMGEAPLRSAIENANFPVMREAYKTKPVTAQEAAHITAYLESIQSETPSAASPPVHIAGFVIAFLLMLGMGLGHARKIKSGTRSTLIQKAVERNLS